MLSLYNVTCMYVFRIDHLILHSQLVYSSPGKIILSILSISELSAVLTGLVATLACLLLSLLGSCLGRHTGDTLWVQLLIFLGEIVSWRTLCSSGSYILFVPLSAMIPDQFVQIYQLRLGSIVVQVAWLGFLQWSVSERSFLDERTRFILLAAYFCLLLCVCRFQMISKFSIFEYFILENIHVS